MSLSFCATALPPWNVSSRRTPFAFTKYAFTAASCDLGFVVNTAPSPMPGISDASGPLVLASTRTLCLMSPEFRPPGQICDASATTRAREVCPHSLVLGPQVYVQPVLRGGSVFETPLPILAFGSSG